jgi:hypothetical protein
MNAAMIPAVRSRPTPPSHGAHRTTPIEAPASSRRIGDLLGCRWPAHFIKERSAPATEISRALNIGVAATRNLIDITARLRFVDKLMDSPNAVGPAMRLRKQTVCGRPAGSGAVDGAWPEPDVMRL